MILDAMFLIYVLIGIVVLLFVIQVLTVGKLFSVVRQMNSLLFEIRILFKSTGVYYVKEKKKVLNINNCQYCKYRMSFIQVTSDIQNDQFYYRCKLRNIEITLSDSCENFKRDHTIA